MTTQAYLYQHDDALKVPAALYWEYRPEWAAWWLMLPKSPTTAQRGFGPFTPTEAVWAGEIHGVPFGASSVEGDVR